MSQHNETSSFSLPVDVHKRTKLTFILVISSNIQLNEKKNIVLNDGGI